MKSRLYALKPGARLAARPSGQAKRVLVELQRDRTPRLATEIADAIAMSEGKPGEMNGPFITRQTQLRVTLYYLLVFKKAGAVVASEQPAVDVDVELDTPAETTTDDIPADANVSEDDVDTELTDAEEAVE